MPSQAIILSIMFLGMLGWVYYQERTRPALAGLNCFWCSGTQAFHNCQARVICRDNKQKTRGKRKDNLRLVTGFHLSSSCPKSSIGRIWLQAFKLQSGGFDLVTTINS